MKNRFALIAAFAASLLALSCQKIEVSQIETGKDVEFSLDITTPAPTGVVMTKATDQEETVVENLALLFYSDMTSAPKVIKINNLGAPAVNSPTSYTYTVTLKSSDAEGDDPLLSGEYYLYAVANYNRVGFGGVNINDLSTKSLGELESYLVSRSQVGVNDLGMSEGALLMSGFYGTTDGKVTLLGGDATVLDEMIHLRRITSKVNFTFQNGNSSVNFVPKSYSIINYPVKSTLFERQGWQTRSGSVDNAGGTFPGSIPAVVTSSSDVTSLENIEFQGNGFTFYTYENVQNAKSAFNTGYAGREKRNTDYDTFTYAPDYGTYVVVKGNYAGPISATNATAVTGDVTYTIHLGDFSNTTGDDANFSVRRNSKYNFTVTVNGVNSIYVEATTNAENQPGAEGNLVAGTTATSELVFDAHYCSCLVTFPTTMSFGNYQIVSKTPLNDNVTYVSGPAGTTGSVPSDIKWVKFVKPASGNIPAYPGTQNTDKYTDIIGLLADINAGTQRFYTRSGDNYVTAAFIDEFVYDDLALSQYVNVDDRELVLKGNANADVSADGHSSYFSDAYFNIRQHSMKSMYKLDNSATDYHPFGIEVIEETKYNQWKYRLSKNSLGTTGDSEYDGYSNCVNGILNIKNNTQWSTYVANGALKSDYRYSQYVFLLRNRDENGDGKIQKEEIKWYIPAAQQAYAIILGQQSLGSAYPISASDDKQYDQLHNNRWYWTSSKDHMHFNTMELNVYFLYTPGSTARPLGSVVCARTLNDPTAIPSDIIKYDSSTKTIAADNLNPGSTRGPISGEYLNHYQLDPINIIPARFEIAEQILEVGGRKQFSIDEIRGINLCQENYSQEADGSDLGQWRIPNEREILSIALTVPIDELKDPSRSNSSRKIVYEIAARTSMDVIIDPNHKLDKHTFKPVYHFQSSGNTVFSVTQAHNYNVTTSFTTTTLSNTTTHAFYIRCVRDVQPAAASADSQ